MTDTSAAAMPPLTIAILSDQCLVWVGLQNIFENSTIVPIVVLPRQKKMPDLLRAESRPDLFILDVETERDTVGTLAQIREAARPVRSYCCAGLRIRAARAKRLPAASTASS